MDRNAMLSLSQQFVASLPRFDSSLSSPRRLLPSSSLAGLPRYPRDDGDSDSASDEDGIYSDTDDSIQDGPSDPIRGVVSMRAHRSPLELSRASVGRISSLPARFRCPACERTFAQYKQNNEQKENNADDHDPAGYDGDRVPHLLYCGHSLCFSCLGQRLAAARVNGEQIESRAIAVGSSQITPYNTIQTPEPLCLSCPFGCAGSPISSDSSPLSFPVNGPLMRALAIEIELMREKQLNTICELCGVSALSVFCRACNIGFCSSCCSSAHRSRAYRRHLDGQVMAIEQHRKNINTKTQMQTCNNHPGERLALFCTTCNVSVCKDCVSSFFHGAHADSARHSVVDQSQANKRITEEFASHQAHISGELTQLGERMRQSATLLADERVRHGDARRQLADDFRMLEDALVNACRKEYSRLATTLANTEVERMNAFNGQRLSDAELLSELEWLDQACRAPAQTLAEQAQTMRSAIAAARVRINASRSAEPLRPVVVKSDPADVLTRSTRLIRGFASVAAHRPNKANIQAINIDTNKITIKFKQQQSSTANDTSNNNNNTNSVSVSANATSDQPLLRASSGPTVLLELRSCLVSALSGRDFDDYKASKYRVLDRAIELADGDANADRRNAQQTPHPMEAQFHSIASVGRLLVSDAATGAFAFVMPTSALAALADDKERPGRVAYQLRVALENSFGRSAWSYSSLFSLPAVELAHTSDCDQNGLLYYLATAQRTAPWSNPAHTGQLSLSASSTLTGEVQQIAARRANSFATLNRPFSWLVVGLPELFEFRLFAYTLVSCAKRSLAARRPIAWRIESSRDQINWRTVDERREPAAATDPASPSSVTSLVTQPVEVNRPCTYFLPRGADASPGRFFRLIQTAANAAGDHHLAVGGIELYGVLVRQKENTPMAMGQGSEQAMTSIGESPLLGLPIAI